MELSIDRVMESWTAGLSVVGNRFFSNFEIFTIEFLFTNFYLF